MTVFVDTGVISAHENSRDQNHRVALAATDALLAGRLGKAYTSDYILDEAVTLVRARTRSFPRANAVADMVLARRGRPDVFEVLKVNGVVFRDALRVFETYHDRDLSFTDATTIALVKRRGIGRVLSFDTDFDGIVDRLDPSNAA